MANQTTPKQLYDVLVSKNFDPQLLDNQGMPAQDPSEADVFSFDWVSRAGKDYGTVVVMFGDEHDMTIYFGDNVGKSMEGDDKKEWFDFLYQLRMLAKRNLQSFSIQNLNKLKYNMKSMSTAVKEGLFESWTGTRTHSWNAKPTEARLMIKHRKIIGEGDARYHYVESLFIETVEGERFKLPFTKISAAKAMLEHIKQGGKPYDARGIHITEIVNEMNVLSRFYRANKNVITEDEQQLVQEVTQYHADLKSQLSKIASHRGYTQYFEAWNPEITTEQAMVIEGIRTLFATESGEHRIERALPVLTKIKTQGNNMKEMGIFEGWMACLAEGTWELPDTPEKQQQLITLLSKELPVGADATNATEQLYNVLGNDDLFNQLEDLAREDADADARTIIINFLEQMADNPAVAQVIGKLKIEQRPVEPQEPVAEKAEEVCEYEEVDDTDDQIQRISELSGDTLKSYINKATSQIADKNVDDATANKRFAGISKAIPKKNKDSDKMWGVRYMEEAPKDPRTQTEDPPNTRQPRVVPNNLNAVKEASDTVKFDADRKPVEWSHDSDWKKIPKRDGKPVDPRGEVANLAGRELKRAKERAGLTEGQSIADYKAKIAAMPDAEVKMLLTVMTGHNRDNPWDQGIIKLLKRELDNREHDAVWDLQHGDKQINELSKETMKSYLEKGIIKGMRDSRDGKGDISANREAGLNKAMAKVYSKEDQLDELNKDTLGSYVKKASRDATISRKIAGDFENRAKTARKPDMKSANASIARDFQTKSFKRQDNIERAVDRLVREEDEQINELSPDTLKSYADKSNADIKDRFNQTGDNNDKKLSNRMTGWGKAVSRLSEEEDVSPVESAILNRIMMAHTDLLEKYGPQAVMDAVRDEAEFVGDTDEIGSSDVSGWVKNVSWALEKTAQYLKSRKVDEDSDDMTDMTRWMDRYDEQEDRNYHMENAVAVAELVGTPDDKKLMQAMMHRYEMRGHLSEPDSKLRNEVMKRLWPLVQRKEADWNNRVNDSIKPDGEMAREGMIGKIAGSLAGGALGGPVGATIGGMAGDALQDKLTNETDMGQADSTLRSQPRDSESEMSLTHAMGKAAKEMGYDHWTDVPDNEDSKLKSLTKAIRGLEEGTALSGQYGHAGKMAPVKAEQFSDQFAEDLARLKALSLIK